MLLLELLLGDTFEEVLKSSLLDQLDHTLVCTLIKWVQVVAERAREHDWVLRDHRDLVPQICDVQLGDVDSIDLNLSSHQLDDTCQSHANSGFTGSSATHNSNLFTWADLEAELTKHNLSVRAIAQLNILELNLALTRPLCIWFISAFGFLLRGLLQIQDLLYVNHHALEPIEAAEQVHEPGHVLAVSEGDDQSDVVDNSLVHDADDGGQEAEERGCPVHAQVEPDPAAMVRNEVNCGVVEKAILFGHDCFLLLEGSDDTLASH